MVPYRAAGSYKCYYCDKKFKGAEYLEKHTRNKHGEELGRFQADARDKVCLPWSPRRITVEFIVPHAVPS